MRKEDIDRFKKFTDKLQGKEEKGDYHYMALCPAHGDANVSLWVKLDDSGRILIKCHAGCVAADIVNKMGFSMSILYPVAQITDVFDFITVDGQLLYQEVKYDKTAIRRFMARRPNNKKNSKDKWIWDIKGIPLILYNLFEITNAKEGEIIFMNEGAKDARTLLRLGLISTAALFNNWRDTDTKPLNGKNVIILVDNDDAGEIKALQAAHDRRGNSSSIKLLRLPGLGEGEDVTDWLEKGGAKKRLLELAETEDLKVWHPKESVRQCISNKMMTGMAFEHGFPRPIFLEWLEVFHPSEEGPLHFWDGVWLKSNPKELLAEETSENYLLEQMEQLLLYCNNSKSKNSDEEFKPTPPIKKMILDNGETLCDLNVLKHPTLPIFVINLGD